MSYHKPGVETLKMIEQGLLTNTEDCFLCGEPITGAFVYWQGTTGIALHEGCADRLAWDLVKDAAVLRLEAQR